MRVLRQLISHIWKRGPKGVRKPVTDPENRLYVIGDIHGRADLLERLMDSIIEDVRNDPPVSGGTEIVFLGDYVDRGDQSSEVVEILMRLYSEPKISTHFLKGNHEAMMLDFVVDPEEGASWLHNGGLSTLMSYGIRGLSETADAASRIRASRELREALGLHLVFLRDVPQLMFQSGNVICVHAAFDADVPASEQSERTLLWGRDSFLSKGGPSGHLIVHGHTITSEPDFGVNRLGIDTGAYFSGRLTAARIDKNGVRFITT